MKIKTLRVAYNEHKISAESLQLIKRLRTSPDILAFTPQELPSAYSLEERELHAIQEAYEDWGSLAKAIKMLSMSVKTYYQKRKMANAQ